MSDVIYVGSGKKATTKFGDILKHSFHRDDIKKMLEYMDSDGGDWVNIDIMERKEASEKGFTHYGKINTWKPEAKSTNDGDLPF